MAWHDLTPTERIAILVARLRAHATCTHAAKLRQTERERLERQRAKMAEWARHVHNHPA